MIVRHVVAVAAFLALTGCATMVGGQNLSDDTIRSDIAGVLGDTPDNITIDSRRTDGANTYVNATTKRGMKLVCTILGGGIMTMGMRPPASCNQIAQTGQLQPAGVQSCNALLRAAGQCK